MSYPHYPTDCHEYHGLVCDFGGERPRIVCLCGSTRFVDTFNEQRKILTERGEIVLSIEVVTTQAREDDPQHSEPELKARPDELHKRKIDLCDSVLVVSDGSGYFGDSTSGEIQYAAQAGKPIVFLVPAAARRALDLRIAYVAGPCTGCGQPREAHLPEMRCPDKVPSNA
jgi:hypothetical protein